LRDHSVQTGGDFYLGEFMHKNEILKKHYDAVRYDIANICSYKHIYNETKAIVQNNTKINIRNSFYTFVNQTYAIALFMCVRRHVKIFKKHQKRSYSLVYLLHELKDYFEKKNDNDRLCKVNKDIEMIGKYAKKYEVIIDKAIPHLDKDIIGENVTYNMLELEECVEKLYNCAGNYFNDFYPNDGYIGFHIPDGETWKDIFKTPWIEEK
jgi:DNA repair ATPase RecN